MPERSIKRESKSYHVELEQEEEEEEDAEVVVDEEVELKHHAEKHKQEGG